MISSTHTLIGALQIISRQANTDDGVIEATLNEAASRLQELDNEVTQLRIQMEKFEKLKEAYRQITKTGTGGVG